MTGPATPPTMLTPTARRMVVATMVQAQNSAVDSMLVADARDATAAGILRVSGVEDVTIARIVMSWLWTDPVAPSLPPVFP